MEREEFFEFLREYEDKLKNLRTAEYSDNVTDPIKSLTMISAPRRCFVITLQQVIADWNAKNEARESTAAHR